jgi:hypothetical protein
MKHCPSCKTNYADDTLQFCLQDGTQLTELSNAQIPTVIFNEAEAETVVRIAQPQRTDFNQAAPTGQNWEQRQTSAQLQPPPKKSNTALAVLLTAFGMILLFGLGVGAWFLLGGKKNVPGNRDFPTPTKTPANTNTNTNTNASPTPKVSPSTTITPTVNPTPSFDAEEVKSEVSDEMYAWKSSMESGSLDSVMSHYASTLEYYYKSRGTSASAVRANKQKAFDKYYEFRVSIGNMTVTPDESGQKATAVFNKSWTFEGSGDRNTGTVRAQFQLTKIGGKWYITGEKDL